MPPISQPTTTQKLPLPPTGERSALLPFRRAVLGGLAVLLPPLLTIVILVWAWNTVVVYLLEPMEAMARWAIVKRIADIRQDLPVAKPGDDIAIVNGERFHRVEGSKFIPEEVYRTVQENQDEGPPPTAAWNIYHRYVEIRYLRRTVVVPIFLCGFLLVLYLLGKFLAAGFGQFFWSRTEKLITRVPVINSVYSSVKQVTDFMLEERELEYTRIVAVEYPRKGIWSIAFVTGEGFHDVSSAANEPVLSCLIPTSPAPFTGFTVIVKRSEVLDLTLTIDQALQYIISCGVVLPPHQLPGAAHLGPSATGKLIGNGAATNDSAGSDAAHSNGAPDGAAVARDAARDAGELKS